MESEVISSIPNNPPRVSKAMKKIRKAPKYARSAI
jgi:hypothetical protein